MRRCILVLILFFSGLPLPASAMEVFLGTVETIDREQGRMTLRVVDASGDENAAEGDPVTVEIAPERMPGNIGPGDTIRIWGNFTGRDSDAVFRADTIRSGFGGGGRRDPTGVRGRLGRGGPGGSMGGRMGGGGQGRR